VTPYPSQQPKKLAVLATHEVHAQIENLLVALRKALGYQVSIEARFLVVSENFLTRDMIGAYEAAYSKVLGI
jgi:hypothetical protein